MIANGKNHPLFYLIATLRCIGMKSAKADATAAKATARIVGMAVA
jgi:hypothetical protein